VTTAIKIPPWLLTSPGLNPRGKPIRATTPRGPPGCVLASAHARGGLENLNKSSIAPAVPQTGVRSEIFNFWNLGPGLCSPESPQVSCIRFANVILHRVPIGHDRSFNRPGIKVQPLCLSFSSRVHPESHEDRPGPSTLRFAALRSTRETADLCPGGTL